MTGQEDIEATCEALADRISELDGVPALLVLPMYSQLPADLQVPLLSRLVFASSVVILQGFPLCVCVCVRVRACLCLCACACLFVSHECKIGHYLPVSGADFQQI